MISKGNIVEYVIKNMVFLSAGGAAWQILADYNPIHALIGGAGQILFLIANYLRLKSSGVEMKKQPIAFWVGCIALGAALGYLFTTWTSKKIGIDEVLSGIIIGASAQFAADIFDVFIDVIKKKIKKDE
jgi:hypothetical protein